MKKLLCFIGIFVLLFLTLLPPALRMFVKDKDETPSEEIKSQTLFCTGKYMTNTNYEGDKITRIVIKKIINKDEEEENEDTNPSDIDTVFDNLKNSGVLTVNELEDGEAINIDIEFINQNKLDITKITQKIEEQKIYYENNALTCTIRE